MDSENDDKGGFLLGWGFGVEIRSRVCLLHAALGRDESDLCN